MVCLKHYIRKHRLDIKHKENLDRKRLWIINLDAYKYLITKKIVINYQFYVIFFGLFFYHLDLELITLSLQY